TPTLKLRNGAASPQPLPTHRANPRNRPRRSEWLGSNQAVSSDDIEPIYDTDHEIQSDRRPTIV
ncbi:MAG: hypothetical protein EAZ61_12810, partial [Oscillatoriales cyanobacterium]